MDRVRSIGACMTLLASGSAAAADSGFYFGVLSGQTRYDFEETEVVVFTGGFAGGSPTPIIRPSPTPIPPIFNPGAPAFAAGTAAGRLIQWPQDGDDEASAWGALVGYRIGRYAAVELSYMDLGSLEARETITGGIFVPFVTTFEHEIETSGPAVSALGILPIGESFEIYARAGILFADMEMTLRVVDSSVPTTIAGDSSITFGSDSLLWGGGAQFNWGEHWSVRLDFQRFESVGDDNAAGVTDIDLLSLGVLFRL